MSAGNGVWDENRKYVLGKLDDHERGIRANAERIESLRERLEQMEKRLILWGGMFAGAATLLNNLGKIVDFASRLGG